MKQNILITLCAIMAFALVACEAPQTNTNTTTNTTNTNTTNTETNTDTTNATNSESGEKAGEMSAEKDIVENASLSENHKTLVKAVQAAGLAETLKGEGPFTVFGPTDAAFEKLPEGTLEDLLKPENKEKLASILKYHVVAQKLDAKAVAEAIKAGNGKATVKTVAGGELTASLDGDKVIITDAKGGKATVTTADLMSKNGVIHVVDAVLMPE